jgi:pimeloyl-ACP methyl ester carboxylesterase
MTDELRTDLAVHRFGRPHNEAPTLLFVHGLTDSGEGWPGAVAHWQDRYSIIAYDQRGHGRSPRFTAEQRGGHPGDLLVDDLVALLDQLGEAPVVVGHSLGGAVALAAAVRRPDLVRALVLEDPAVLAPDDEQRSPGKGEELVAGLAGSLEATDDDALFEARRRQHPDWPEDELLVTGRAEQQVDRELLAAGDYKPSPRWPDLLEGLLTATLLVTGDQDVVVDAAVEKLVETAGSPNLTLVRVPGAGHCVRRERPERFYALVDEFLTSH